MEQDTAEVFIVVVNAIGAGIPMFVAHVLQPIMDTMEPDTSRRFLKTLKARLPQIPSLETHPGTGCSTAIRFVPEFKAWNIPRPAPNLNFSQPKEFFPIREVSSFSAFINLEGPPTLRTSLKQRRRLCLGRPLA